MVRQVHVISVGFVLLVLASSVILPFGSLVAYADDEPIHDEPAVWITIDIDSEGDAHWSIEYRFDIESQEAEAAFDRLVAGVQADDSHLPLNIEAMEAFRLEAAETTEREMSISDAEWRVDTDDTVGILSLELTWHGFAGVVGDSLEVGSAFQSADGTWFETIGEGMRLTIIGPDPPINEVPTDASLDGEAVTWDGPHTFAPGEIDLRFDVPHTTPVTTVIGMIALLVVLFAGAGLAIAYHRGWRLDSLTRDTDDHRSSTDAIDPELLSDPERVERMLREGGGRMKQATIVEETGWSSAKVSQLLSEMADGGRIEKLRIGQENLISLPTDDDSRDSDR